MVSASGWPVLGWFGQNMLAVATLLLSILALRREIRDRRKSLSESSASARQQYNADLRDWTNRCLSAFAEARSVLEQRSVEEWKLGEMGARFSALADQGRLFFPNRRSGVAPADHQDRAKRGLRPRILDWLIFSFRVYRTVGATPDLKAAQIVFEMQRAFTADAQEIIDPLDLFSTMEDLDELLGQARCIVDTSQSHQTLLAAKQLLESRASGAGKPDPTRQSIPDDPS